jgi:hypothetical protein
MKRLAATRIVPIAQRGARPCASRRPNTAQGRGSPARAAQLQKSPWLSHESTYRPSHYPPLSLAFALNPLGLPPIQARASLATLRSAAWRPLAHHDHARAPRPMVVSLRSRPPPRVSTVTMGGGEMLECALCYTAVIGGGSR